MNLPAGVSSHTVQTKRLRMKYIESGPADGVPVVMVHGNLSTGRFFEHLMPGAPENLRIIAPDMRGFGDTEQKPIDVPGAIPRLRAVPSVLNTAVSDASGVAAVRSNTNSARIMAGTAP